MNQMDYNRIMRSLDALEKSLDNLDRSPTKAETLLRSMKKIKEIISEDLYKQLEEEYKKVDELEKLIS